MAGITQHITSYVQGISDQPDELKLPGQVRDALNVLPDVTQGLLKRPGARLVNPISDTEEGSWFHIYRDKTDQYVGRVKQDGTVDIWSCTDGMPRVVTYQSKPFVRYPNNPDDGDDVGKPGIANCDYQALNTATDDYRKAVADTKAKRKELDALQEALAAAEATAIAGVTSYEVKDYGNYVIPITGHVDVPNTPYQFGFNRPQIDQATHEVVLGNIRYRGMVRVPVDAPVTPKPPTTNRIQGRAGFGNFPPVGTKAYDAVIYEWLVRPKDGATPPNAGEIAALKAQIAAAETALATLEDAEFQARKAYELQAGPCGVPLTPVGLVARQLRNSTTPDNVLSYLKHKDDTELQFLTVNDYTFVTNRKRICTMSGAIDQYSGMTRSFISLSQIAYNKVYAINLYTPDAAPHKTRTATKLRVVRTANMGEAGSCPANGSQIFDINQTGKTNLRFELRVVGTSVPKNENDPYAGYKCDYTTIDAQLMNGGEGWEVGDEFSVDMNGATYWIQVEEVDEYDVIANIAAIRPPTTSSDSTTTLKAEQILNDLKSEIEKVPGFFATIIGNGILVESYTVYNIATPESQLMTIMTEQVNNVARLPSECISGYVVKVVNSAEAEDDYYLEFKATKGDKGEGVWEETTKPGIRNSFNPDSMPHQIVFIPSENRFIVSPVDWEPRLVGDNITNPQPSFIKKTINKLLFFRNRLCLLSDENVILSRPGDYWNFWAKTAMTVTAADVIDVSVSSTYPSILFDGIEVNAGLLLFSSTQQFLLTTDNDILTPETVKVNSVASYQYNTNTPVVSLGTTVGFLNNAGRNSRFFEMVNIRREGEVEVLEQSKPIADRMPTEMSLLAESRENSLLLAAPKGVRTVWGYRYFNSGRERIQSAWFRWELTGDLIYHFIIKDVYFAVLKNKTDSASQATIISLQRFDLRNTDWTAIVEDADQYPYTVHMDNYRVVLPSQLQYYPHLNQTYFRLPMGYYRDKRFAAYTLKRGKYQGRAIYPNIEVDSLGTWAVLEGDWSDTRLMIGYEFDMDVELPTIFYTKSEGEKVKADTRSSLIVHRVKFDLGPVGVYDTLIERKGRPAYTHLYESREQDGYNADAVAFTSKAQAVVPVYERNTNLSIHLRSSHPSPATLYSMTWEGDYNQMYYQRV